MFMCAAVYKQNSSHCLFFRPFWKEIASRYFGGAAKFQSSDRRTWATVHVLPFYKARFLASVAMLACKRTQSSGWTHVVVVSFFFSAQRREEPQAQRRTESTGSRGAAGYF